MNEDFLYFLQALQEIDKKYFKHDNFGNKEPLFLGLMKWPKYHVEWNKDNLDRMKELRKELLLTGLEVTEIEELNYSYRIAMSLPKNPTTTLLYDQT